MWPRFEGVDMSSQERILANDLSGKIILVVGGGAGIGKATAELCAARGAMVVVADIDEAAARQVAAEVQGVAVQVDVTDEASVMALFAQIAAWFGRLDALDSVRGRAQGRIYAGRRIPLRDLADGAGCQPHGQLSVRQARRTAAQAVGARRDRPGLFGRGGRRQLVGGLWRQQGRGEQFGHHAGEQAGAGQHPGECRHARQH